MFGSCASSVGRIRPPLVASVLALVGAFGSATASGSSTVACPSATPGRSFRCYSHAASSGTTSPTGLSPAAIQAAYGWPTRPTAGAGKTIAIVDARDDPNAEADLGAFDSQYGLPPCTAASGCFAKVDENGGTNYPSFDNGWAFEISIDIEWAHAIAPAARILLIEAQSSNNSHLFAAEDYARAHAQYVSDSWGASEFATESKYDFHFVQPGTSFFVSSGDLASVQYPSASPNVVSVGGTQLNFDASGNLLSESGWSDGGGGCSKYEPANQAQSGFSAYPAVGCAGMRATPDVAAVSLGVSVYDSNPFGGQTGNWFSAFGTSIASPMWAARSADTGIAVDAPRVYSSTITYRQITTGGNGNPCLPIFNLCAGRGSWIGTKP